MVAHHRGGRGLCLPRGACGRLQAGSAAKPQMIWRQTSGRQMRQPNKKAPAEAGALEVLTQGGDQYFATTGPPQLKR